MANEIVIKEPAIRATVERLLQAAGVVSDHALLVADTVVEASLRGVDSHGVGALGIYLKRIRLGATNPRPKPTVVKEGPAFALVDGDNGLGAIAAWLAMDKAIRGSGTSGIYAAVCRNNTTFGAAFYYSRMAALQGKVGIALCNAPPAMAPWGGKKALLGTNPISISFPSGDGHPVVVDMATSAAAKSRIYLAREKGEKIPPGWALDREGRPTTDPEEGLKGMVMPLGGAKGYALSLAVDLLCGGLSGGGCLASVGSLHNALDRGQNVSFFLAAIDPQVFAGDNEAFVRTSALAREALHSCPPSPGFEQVFLPGEIEEQTRARRLVEGIPVPAPALEELKAEGRLLGVEVDFR